jgi:hypothetical protein
LSYNLLVKKSYPEFLVGWKQIADYLGLGVRTVQRYERLHGLPVRHLENKARSSAIATKIELDAWIAARPVREAFTLRASHSAVHNSVALATQLRAGIRQMIKLQDETRALRKELDESLKRVRERSATQWLHFQSHSITERKPN